MRTILTTCTSLAEWASAPAGLCPSRLSLELSQLSLRRGATRGVWPSVGESPVHGTAVVGLPTSKVLPSALVTSGPVSVGAAVACFL